MQDSRPPTTYQQLDLFADLPSLPPPPAVGPKPPRVPRLAFTWYPLFGWSIDDVWQACGITCEDLAERRTLYQEGVRRQDAALREQALAGGSAHPAYVCGANRLSCMLCGI